MKILNLYAGIGGNRKLWPDNHDITAVEINPDIAEIYKKLYPKDKVIIGDAHDYLLKNFSYCVIVLFRKTENTCLKKYFYCKITFLRT